MRKAPNKKADLKVGFIHLKEIGYPFTLANFLSCCLMLFR